MNFEQSNNYDPDNPDKVTWKPLGMVTHLEGCYLNLKKTEPYKSLLINVKSTCTCGAE